jgi:hypothetical protein
MQGSSNVWVVIPSRNIERAKSAVKIWQTAGYKVCCIFDMDTTIPNRVDEFNSIFQKYGDKKPIDICVKDKIAGADSELIYKKFPGYWLACNEEVRILANESKTIVLAADDMEPDPNKHPSDIEKEIYEKYPDGYCVMQPTGDDKNGMDGVWRICGSPWFGIGWIREAYEGKGPCPLPPFAFYGDEHIFNVSKNQGVLWQRPDLSQFHNHWCRTDSKKTKRLDYQITNSDLWWDKDQKWFFDQRDKNFPGSERKISGWLPEKDQ